MDCWCPPDWKDSTAEEFADAIERLMEEDKAILDRLGSLPTDVCILKEGKCANPTDCHCARLEPKPGEAW